MKQYAVWFLCLMMAVVCVGSADARPTKRYFKTYKIVLYGDGFTSGQGIEPDNAYAVPLRTDLNLKFTQERIEVVNAGVAGDTVASALSRLASILAEKPDVVVVALGATDALRRTDPTLVHSSLSQILSLLTQNNIYVLLVGSSPPADASIEYAVRFSSLFPSLAKRYQVAYMPTMLKEVEGVWYNLQYDKIYPNEEGHQQIAKNLMQPLSDMINRMRQ